MSKKINQEALNTTLRFLEKMGQSNMEQLKQTDPVNSQQLDKLDALFNNMEFCQQFLSCADKQEAVRLFADHGFTFTEEHIDKLVFQINGLIQKLMENDGVLNEEDLEQIAGGASATGGLIGALTGFTTGASVGALWGTLFCPGIGSLIGAIVGGAVGGIGLGIGAGLKSD